MANVRNPNWSREETILALDLYLSLDRTIPTITDERVSQLSATLRRNPTHVDSAKKASFRNPTSVLFKIQNIHSAAGKSGFEHNSKLDRQLWDELGGKPSRVRALADTIRTAIDAVNVSDFEHYTSDPVFSEGEIVTRMHITRERNPKLRASVIKQRRKSGQLRCDGCETIPFAMLGDIGIAVFEIHHLTPLASTGKRKVRAADVAFLCANCHRLIHALISETGKWIGIADLRQTIDIDI